MSTRERMTWGGKSAAGVVLPVEQAAKKASAHPQTPDEGITHPAGYQDPTQPAAYENGDTSSWAEDVHPGPYRTSPAPANPMDDGGYRHPAAQPGAPAKNASTLRAAAERKASKCIRIASALLGEEITKAAEAEDKVAVELIEAQALDFMNLSDEHIASTLRRIEAATMDEDVLLRKMLAGEDEEEEEEEPKEESAEKKEASAQKRADEAKFAEITSMLAGLQAQLAAMQGGGPSKAAEAVDEEAMLAAMMAEEAPAPVSAEADEDAMLKAMLAEEAAPAPEADAAAGKSLADYLDDDMGGISMDGIEDPMGLGYDDAMMMDTGDDEILASLFASDKSAKKAEDEEEEAAEPEEEEEAKEDKSAAARTAAARSRTAALRPQPKKPSVGAQSVGTQVRVASDLNELSRLWESAPDVTKVFNS
jgi:hypothetical protein